MPKAFRVVLDIELAGNDVNSADVSEHVKQAIKNWGGSQPPDDMFFPPFVTVSGVSVIQRRRPRLPPKKQALALKRGDMAVDGDGDVGLVADPRDVTGLVLIQYGGEGPFKRWLPQVVRHATLAEIEAAGLDGVGRNPTPQGE